MSLNIKPNEFLEAKASVLERIKEGTPEPKAPDALPLEEIETIPELFQQRRITPEESADHVQSLARAIRVGPRGAHQDSLAPITVMWVGDAWACVDGHHRLGAYRLVKHEAHIPVVAMSGSSLEDAIRASLGENTKDKLMLTKRRRSEAAWRFVVMGGQSKLEIAKLSGVDESTVAAMRRAVKEFKEKSPNTDPGVLTWMQMRMWKLEPVADDGKEADQRRAEKFLRRTEKHLKDASPRVIFMALALHKPGLIAELVKLHEAHEDSAAYRADPFPHIPSDEEMSPEF